MKSIINKPYLLSWLSIPLLIIIGLLFREHLLEIQLYDTYLVIANIYFVAVGSVLLLLIGIGYWLLSLNGKTPNPALSIIHITLTVIILILFALPLFSGDSLTNAELFSLSTLIFLTGQFIYVVNILITILSRKRVSS